MTRKERIKQKKERFADELLAEMLRANAVGVTWEEVLRAGNEFVQRKIESNPREKEFYINQSVRVANEIAASLSVVQKERAK